MSSLIGDDCHMNILGNRLMAESFLTLFKNAKKK